jgi:hypothetical protein
MVLPQRATKHVGWCDGTCAEFDHRHGFLKNDETQLNVEWDGRDASHQRRSAPWCRPFEGTFVLTDRPVRECFWARAAER